MVLEGLLTSTQMGQMVRATQAQQKALIMDRNVMTKVYQERIVRAENKWAVTFRYYIQHMTEKKAKSVGDPLFNRFKFD